MSDEIRLLEETKNSCKRRSNKNECKLVFGLVVCYIMVMAIVFVGH